jgi:glucokinase
MAYPDDAGALPADAVLALDLGATQIRAAVVTGDGAVHERRGGSTPIGDGPDAVVGACIRSLESVRAAYETSEPAMTGRLLGIGISAPGPVDPFRGVIVDPPNMGPRFRDIPLAERVGASLGLATVLDRDTQVAAMAEAAHGAARGCSDFLYITVSSGIGGAIVSDGHLLRGPDGAAGELGHILVDRGGPLCGCGARGHLEAIASGVAIAASARAVAQRGESPALAGLISDHGPSFGARHVAAAEEAGDPVSAAIMADARDAFAQACVSLVDMFNPERIVVGGSLARGQGDRWLGPAREAVVRDAFRLAGHRVAIVPAELGDDVGLVGGFELVRSRLGA